MKWGRGHAGGTRESIGRVGHIYQDALFTSIKSSKNLKKRFPI